MRLFSQIPIADQKHNAFTVAPCDVLKTTSNGAVFAGSGCGSRQFRPEHPVQEIVLTTVLVHVRG